MSDRLHFHFSSIYILTLKYWTISTPKMMIYSAAETVKYILILLKIVYQVQNLKIFCLKGKISKFKKKISSKLTLLVWTVASVSDTTSIL